MFGRPPTDSRAGLTQRLTRRTRRRREEPTRAGRPSALRLEDTLAPGTWYPRSRFALLPLDKSMACSRSPQRMHTRFKETDPAGGVSLLETSNDHFAHGTVVFAYPPGGVRPWHGSRREGRRACFLVRSIIRLGIVTPQVSTIAGRGHGERGHAGTHGSVSTALAMGACTSLVRPSSCDGPDPARQEASPDVKAT
jgi:hypothetical protein